MMTAEQELAIEVATMTDEELMKMEIAPLDDDLNCFHLTLGRIRGQLDVVSGLQSILDRARRQYSNINSHTPLELALFDDTAGTIALIREAVRRELSARHPELAQIGA